MSQLSQVLAVDTSQSAASEFNRGVVVPDGVSLVQWIMPRVNRWEDHRNRGYARRWAEYWRLWRGIWSNADATRGSERSRIIAPALAQALTSAVAEVEEAVLSKHTWVDISDDIRDEERMDALMARDNFLEDTEATNGKDALSSSFFIGGLFGTGIMKLNTEVQEVPVPTRNPQTGELEVTNERKALVPWEAIRPDNFIPDPSGTTIKDMLGCAHKMIRPVHSVLEKIEKGIYRREALATLAPAQADKTGHQADHATDPQAILSTVDADSVEIVEYHGKVPMKFLRELQDAPATPLDAVLAQDIASRPQEGDGPLVEAIVTIARGTTLLRAIVNPFVMKDRSIIAFQWEKVPGRFWGRGVMEQGINPQKALDAEMRARIDALGYISAPMLGIDSTRLDRGFKPEVKPGKLWLTNGNPNEVLNPVTIGQINPNTFNQTGELMQMVQMGTGALDTASAIRTQTQSGGSGAQANSALMGSFVKRSKRVIGNIDRNLITPLVRQSLWRYMQFSPLRYPSDFKFVVKPTLGIMAKEVEQLNLTQLMAMLPDQFPQVSLAVTKGLIELSSVNNKVEILSAVDEALQPPSEEEQARQQELSELSFEQAKAEATQALLENQKTMSEIRENLAKANQLNRRADVEDDKVDIEARRTQLQEQEILAFQRQNDLANRRLDLQEELTAAKIKALQQGKSTPGGN